MLPPGCARLETNPLPTGSDTHANTIGIVRVSACNAAVAGVLMVTSASRFSWTSSLANRRMRSTLPAPSIHPSSKSRLRKAASQAWASGSISASKLPDPLGLLCRSDQRPYDRCAARERNEFASSRCRPGQKTTLVGVGAKQAATAPACDAMSALGHKRISRRFSFTPESGH